MQCARPDTKRYGQYARYVWFVGRNWADGTVVEARTKTAEKVEGKRALGKSLSGQVGRRRRLEYKSTKAAGPAASWIDARRRTGSKTQTSDWPTIAENKRVGKGA